MSTRSAHRISHTVSVASLVLAPLFGVVAAVATPELVSSSTRAQLIAVSEHPDRYYVYSLCILISSYFFIPAIAAVARLLPDDRPAWAEVGYLLAQVSMLVALGDAATEMFWWKAASPGASLVQMTALSERLDAAAGYSLIYTVGGLSGILGITVLATALIRAHAAPVWAAVSLPVGFVVNVVGFSIPSHAVLVVSYVVLVAGCLRLAACLRSPSAVRVTTPGALSEVGAQSAG
jgi:hypothetical protein